MITREQWRRFLDSPLVEWSLFALGILLDTPALAFAIVMFIFPLMRRVVGNIEPDDPPIWNERIATTLDRLPLAYAGALAACVALVLQRLAVEPRPGMGHLVGPDGLPARLRALGYSVKGP